MENTYKIIIADDSPTFLEGLSLLISRNKNFEIIEACKNGTELVNSEHIHYSDLVLTDIEMPEINGIEAAKRINYHYPNLPMIALTMYMERVYLQTLLGAGFRGFIYKPNVAKELSNVINQVLQHKFVFPDYLINK